MAASVSSLTGAPEKLNWPQIPHISSLQFTSIGPTMLSKTAVFPNSLPIGGYCIDPLMRHRIAAVTLFQRPAEFLRQLSTHSACSRSPFNLPHPLSRNLLQMVCGPFQLHGPWSESNL